MMSIVVPASAAYDVADLPTPPAGYTDFLLYTRSGTAYLCYFNKDAVSYHYNGEKFQSMSGDFYVSWLENGAFTTPRHEGVGSIVTTVYSTIFQSSFDILNADGTVFFQGMPPPPIVEAGQLAGLMTIIVGLIPYLLPCVICWIGLRKAWSWLQMQLVGA